MSENENKPLNDYISIKEFEGVEQAIAGTMIMARYAWAFYKALRDEGFDTEQAMDLLKFSLRRLGLGA